MNSSIFGRAGEENARSFLREKGWTIIAENYGTSGGELDIVAYRRGTLVYAEVKARSGSKFGAPCDAVDAVKRQRLKNAAEGFMREQMSGGRIPVYSRLLRRKIYRRVKTRRFDIIEVYMTKQLVLERINIIENAF
ncbi:MAG: YraN family protein [Eubacteriales bacterium]|nr:YraN family protein [Eubacteriales bacterium]